MRKQFICLVALIGVLCLFLSGCIMVIPDKDSVGESKTFEKDGFSILLTDRFGEQESELGFDAYYVSDFCGVMVLKEAFSLEEGLEDRTLEQYTQNVMENNGHSDLEMQNKDGLYFYRYTRNNRCGYSFSYKGSDAFWIVQFVCNASDEAALKDFFLLCAASVTVE